MAESRHSKIHVLISSAPAPQKVPIFGDGGPDRGDYVKMRPSGWVLIQPDWHQNEDAGR